MPWRTLLMKMKTGWGGRDRTFECWNQNPVPYHLATPQQERHPYNPPRPMPQTGEIAVRTRASGRVAGGGAHRYKGAPAAGACLNQAFFGRLSESSSAW